MIRRGYFVRRFARVIAVSSALSACLQLPACGNQQIDMTSDFLASGVVMGGTGALHGQVVAFPASLVSSHPGRIRLVSARLIPLPGFRLPRLVHLGVVVDGCGVAIPGATLNWPPLIQVQGHPVRISRFAGTWVMSGTRSEMSGGNRWSCSSFAIYGITGGSSGPYATAGLRITFMSGSQLTVASVFNGGFAWYQPVHATKPVLQAYLRADHDAFQALIKLAHSQ